MDCGNGTKDTKLTFPFLAISETLSIHTYFECKESTLLIQRLVKVFVQNYNKWSRRHIISIKQALDLDSYMSQVMFKHYIKHLTQKKLNTKSRGGVLYSVTRRIQWQPSRYACISGSSTSASLSHHKWARALHFTSHTWVQC